MARVVETPDLVAFDRDAFERAWHHAANPDRDRLARQTAILIRRASPYDFQDRQIYVWIDEEPLGKIRYGDAITQPIEPGRHTVRVFNTLLSRTLTIDAAPGEQVRLQCGTGMPTAGWLMMIFLPVTYLRVWLARE